MKKTRVLSVRLPVEALQSCFDLADLAGAPTTVAGTAIARSISLLMANLRESGKLPTYTPAELDRLTERWAAKINPASMPSLELSSQADSLLIPAEMEKVGRAKQASSVSQSFEEHNETEQSFDPYQAIGRPQGYNVKDCSIEPVLESLNLDELSLEEEILKQMREVELEDELDLLDKILIS